MTTVAEFKWQQAGGAYYACLGGRIAALLYWYGPDVHYLHGPAGDEPREPGWFLVLADSPDDHLALEAPEPRQSDELAELAEATRAALDAASRKLTAMLGERIR
jgi:hypothetical protein